MHFENETSALKTKDRCKTMRSTCCNMKYQTCNLHQSTQNCKHRCRFTRMSFFFGKCVNLLLGHENLPLKLKSTDLVCGNAENSKLYADIMNYDNCALSPLGYGVIKLIKRK